MIDQDKRKQAVAVTLLLVKQKLHDIGVEDLKHENGMDLLIVILNDLFLDSIDWSIQKLWQLSKIRYDVLTKLYSWI